MSYMSINYWHEFAKINNISPYKKYKLLLIYKNPINFYSSSDYSILAKNIITKIQLKNIRKQKFDSNIKYILEKNKIKIINYYDKSYPTLLKTIYDPPVCLYIKGNVDILDKRKIAIVGSRKNSYYSEKACIKITKQLSKEYVIVSGLANGIDSIAHRNSNSNTIGVLAFGINTCYPSSKVDLKNYLAKYSLLISEYAPSVLPRKMHFVARNRIISGLSIATIIIEASIKSGSLITANFALEQGREIFVLPHNIYADSNGCNHLIEDGGRIIISIEQLYEEIKNVEIY